MDHLPFINAASGRYGVRWVFNSRTNVYITLVDLSEGPDRVNDLKRGITHSCLPYSVQCSVTRGQRYWFISAICHREKKKNVN
jgi:hypothetical protein